eukprot:CAMPEP_0118929942 /NCGR_PEP_ID=MMETSP1169-20130426/6795_1 /TAXON_ID=36882 /ORGANISM="Pyramimonas obovata, Strain CCMP722" /LENGTH=344 /DNA_ID=CAMNT_0006872219 /DNA_START=18 /DNA_END=1052 /DNA_ORIENTATION=-
MSAMNICMRTPTQLLSARERSSCSRKTSVVCPRLLSKGGALGRAAPPGAARRRAVIGARRVNTVECKEQKVRVVEPAIVERTEPVLREESAARNTCLSLASVLAATALMTSPALAETGLDIGSWQDGFASAFLLIFFSEIGDKTFFIAVLLALRQPQGAVFTGTFGALAIMTVISVGLGEVLHLLDEAVHDVLPPALADLPLDDYAAIALLVFFGVTTISQAGGAGETAQEEKAEAEEEVLNLTSGFNSDGTATMLPLIASTFFLVFAAEWGDKSFLATIALAASASPLGVVAGAVAGHGVATGVAVAGGSILGEYVSEQVVAYVGGSLFLVFAGATLADVLSR